MDSPEICFHITFQNNLNNFGLQKEHPDTPNRLRCSINQTREIFETGDRRAPKSLGMIFCRSPRTTGCYSETSLNKDTSLPSEDTTMARETPMRRLKKMGWYWGAISPEYATKLLEHEEDGSFLIRDSSSECYIFSMTLKLDGQVHHARIEHSKGHFSFGRSRKFYCTTIVDFIEQAIEYSHNGNLSFFLHRDPASEGPVRFRMVPLSRMKGLKSLKHLCRFAILPYVRKDRINELSVPISLRYYLNEPFNHNFDDER